jgi:hypothetical protein
LASSRVGRLFAVLTIEIFGFSTYKDLPDVLSLIYSAQLTELQQWLKKNSQIMLSNHFQTMSMLKGVVRVAGLIDSLVSDYQAIFSTSGSPQTKLPEFLQRFKETLQSAEGIVHKGLDLQEQRLEKVKSDAISPSFWDDTRKELDSIHAFYAITKVTSGSSFGASVDGLFYPLRGYLGLANRMKSEKKAGPGLLLNILQVFSKLKEIVSKTQLSQNSQSFSEKLEKGTRETLAVLVGVLVERLVDGLSRIKEEDKKLDIVLTGLEPLQTNPLAGSLKTVRKLYSSHSQYNQLFLDKYIKAIEDVVSSVSKKKDEALLCQLDAAKLSFSQSWNDTDNEEDEDNGGKEDTERDSQP